MKNIYVGLTKAIDGNLFGIFIGLISGLGINIITGQTVLNQNYFKAITLCSIAIVLLIILSIIRQSIERNYHKRSESLLTPWMKWSESSGHDDFRCPLYLVSLIGVILAVGFAISEIKSGNSVENLKNADSQNEDRGNMEIIKQNQKKILHLLNQLPKTKPSTQSPVPKPLIKH